MFRNKIIVALIIIGTGLSVYANDEQDFFGAMKNSYLRILPFYQNTINCTPYKYTDEDGMIHQIYGLENNVCHIKQGSKNCYFPAGIYSKYGNNGIITTKKMISDLNNGTFNYSTDYATDTIKLENTYCKLENMYRR